MSCGSRSTASAASDHGPCDIDGGSSGRLTADKLTCPHPIEARLQTAGFAQVEVRVNE